MAQSQPIRIRPRGRIIGITSVIVVVAGLVGLAVTSTGYDAQETPRLESSVWVTRDAGQYARVNTDLGEIDTVRTVDDPSDIIQVGSQSLVFTQGNHQVWPVDAASPVDFVPDSAATATSATDTDPETKSGGLNTPSNTTDVIAAGSYIVYLTETGKVYLGTIAADSDGRGAVDPTVTVAIDPFAEETNGKDKDDGPVYNASAAAIADDGQVVLYSADEKSIRRYNAVTHEFVGGPIALDSAPKSDADLDLAVIGGHWVLSEPGEKQLWVDGHSGPVDTGLGAGALLQSSATTGKVAYLSDSKQLVAVDLGSGRLTDVADGTGVAAAPVAVAGVVYAAWLTATGGTLWSSDTGKTIALVTQEDELNDIKTLVPVFRSNGQRAVLSEQTSGMLWTVPDGVLIPVEQWTINDSELDTGTVEVDDVAEPEPPVAVADSFGVRSGELVRLSLLLNDSDPNKKDVLSIDEKSITGGLSDGAFGDLGLISNDQEAVILVRAASGSATFSYAATDGSASSAPVTVTLTVVPDGQNSAPVWCGVTDCTQVWPTPQVAPGGTITVPVLSGWVDAEGDPVVLIDAVKDNVDDPLTVVPTADGRIAIRHTDANGAGGTIPITVTVSDSNGATATKKLELTVTASPALTVSPVSVVAGVNETKTVIVGDHVTGGSGAFRLVDSSAVSQGESSLVVVPNTAAGTIALSSAVTGSFALTFTVQDALTLAEQTAIIRLTVVAADVPLKIAPITAFVRANEDTTVDVLGAVQNSTGRVLIVSDASTLDAALSIGVVGQSSVRVSGSTADGKPGRIGHATVTVTDGTSSTVTGVVTVFLVAPSTGIGPIAVPDTVTVRANGQVDIPVTANDISPRGERLLVSPEVTGSGKKGELVFVTGDAVRYLAPSTPGVYELRYSIYLENEPERLDSASITITVLDTGTNRDPQPPILTAHVLSGQTVTIPVNGYGMDPDGDSVVLAGVTQPEAGKGVASISADGAAILYTAPGNGVQGSQLSFAYSVRDSQNAEADGVVRVGVLDSDLSDSAPVTYSDYIRAKQGSTTSVTILPLLNDQDPSDGQLELIDLVPNAPAVASNPEYARLKGLIDPATSLKDGSVKLLAGDVLGTHSYIYTVQSPNSSSTSQGLIVVTVTDASTPDQPEVADTVLTAKNRNLLATGIDVVSGKVQWPSGDASDLDLTIWGDAAGRYSVNGHEISGALDKGGDMVPFSLTGTDAAGNEVTSYGFLRIPAFNDMRVQLRSSFAAIAVGEEKSVEFNVLDVIDADPADTVEFRDDDSYVVQRANSTCEPGDGGKATYTAGREAPWTDYCAVPVRIAGQTSWTVIAVPITIEPKDPLAQLSSISRTIAPGQSDTVDLYDDMTSWQGNRVGDQSILDYASVYSGTNFVVTQAGGVVTIDARADAAPGTHETVQIAVSSYGGLSAGITLVVGVAAPDAPKGATFTKACSVKDGPSCAIKVVGVAGEYDPFQGKVGSGLHVVGLGIATSVVCPMATVTIANDSTVTATYPAGPKPAGGVCLVPFTVEDAQGRSGTGQLSVDISGYPARPSSLTTDSYTGTSVTLLVTMGEAALAHPGVDSVVLLEGGSSASSSSCVPAGGGNYRCTVTGLSNGEHHTYTALAKNGTGESLETSALTTWAYQPPQILSFTARTVYDASITSESQGAVEVTVGTSSDTVRFVVESTGQVVSTPTANTVTNIRVPVGSQTVKLVPQSAEVSPLTGDNRGTGESLTLAVAGNPTFAPTPAAATATSNTEIEFTVASLGMNSSVKSKTVVYLAWLGGDEPVCAAVPDGTLLVTLGGSARQSAPNATTIVGLEDFEVYSIKACGSNEFGINHTPQGVVYTGKDAPEPPAGQTYTIGPDALITGGGESASAKFRFSSTTVPALTGFATFYSVSHGALTASPTFNPESIPSSVAAYYCSTVNTALCSDPVSIAPATGATTITVWFACIQLLRATAGASAPGFDLSDIADVSVADSKYTIAWKDDGPFAGLTDVISPVMDDCSPFH